MEETAVSQRDCPLMTRPLMADQGAVSPRNVPTMKKGLMP